MHEPQLIRSELFHSLGITALFSERRGGVSKPPYDSLNLGYRIGDDEQAVTANMQRLVAYGGLASQPHQAEQEHGTAHLICSGSGYPHDTKADILVSREPGTGVAVRTADCLPLLLADPVAGVVAAVHAGWRGTAQRIAVRAIEIMQQQGATTGNIHASLGPAIGPCCFEIGEETADQLARSAKDACKAITSGIKPHADLVVINSLQLREAGLDPSRIESNRLCTSCHAERFYSYRRDHGTTGRHLAVVALPQAI